MDDEVENICFVVVDGKAVPVDEDITADDGFAEGGIGAAADAVTYVRIPCMVWNLPVGVPV